jgi:hypothetical protein
MASMKRSIFGALLFIGSTLYARAPAQIGYPLTPTGVESGATGQYALTKFHLILVGINSRGQYFELWQGCLTVTCQGLTSGAKYSTTAGIFKADRNGNGSVQDARFYMTYIWTPAGPVANPVMVCRINSDGSQTRVLGAMLSYPPW